jgi:hypothetical protein
MSRKITTSPPRQNDPSPWSGDKRNRRRIIIFVVVVMLGAAFVWTGRDLGTVLLTLLGISLVAATIARWVVDDGPLPNALAFARGLPQ